MNHPAQQLNAIHAMLNAGHRDPVALTRLQDALQRITAIAIADEDELISAGRELSLRWTNMTTGTAVTPALDTAGQIEQVVVNHNGEEALIVAAILF